MRVAKEFLLCAEAWSHAEGGERDRDGNRERERERVRERERGGDFCILRACNQVLCAAFHTLSEMRNHYK